MLNWAKVNIYLNPIEIRYKLIKMLILKHDGFKTGRFALFGSDIL